MERSNLPPIAFAIGRSVVVLLLGGVVLALASRVGRAIARKVGADAWRRRFEEPP